MTAPPHNFGRQKLGMPPAPASVTPGNAGVAGNNPPTSPDSNAGRVTELEEALREIAELKSIVPAPDGSGPMIVMRDDKMREIARAALNPNKEQGDA